jgi:hypothetical protein
MEVVCVWYVQYVVTVIFGICDICGVYCYEWCGMRVGVSYGYEFVCNWCVWFVVAHFVCKSSFLCLCKI